MRMTRSNLSTEAAGKIEAAKHLVLEAASTVAKEAETKLVANQMKAAEKEIKDAGVTAARQIMDDATLRAGEAAKQAELALMAEAEKAAAAAAKKIMDEAQKNAPEAAKRAHAHVMAQSDALAKSAAEKAENAARELARKAAAQRAAAAGEEARSAFLKEHAPQLAAGAAGRSRSSWLLTSAVLATAGAVALGSNGDAENQARAVVGGLSYGVGAQMALVARGGREGQ